MLSATDAWKVLDAVPDPEIPSLSVTELGIVREINVTEGGLNVVVTPTYSGCPATDVIAHSIRAALRDAGADAVEIRTRLSPPWTTDWIGSTGREKLRASGIAPPGECAPTGPARPLRFMRRQLACPRCGATDTERLAEFGSTACKALYRCKACFEPFEYFKPI